jgi:serine/threonine protein phosphatase 1
MFELFRKFFRPNSGVPTAHLPAGQRAYVIGDIHGQLDLFEELILAVERDDLDAGPAETTIILLGDLVDRGPDSAGVLDRARRWQAERPVRILAGNHEEMFLKSFSDINMLRHFLKHGGRETVLSYGVNQKRYNEATLEDLQNIMRAYVPVEDQIFMRTFEEHFTLGDYAFVHAGINPEVPLEDQTRQDLLWIRDPFLSYPGQHSHLIVHGHTIVEDVVERPNRIGIDTGAYRFGRLTALVLEGSNRRYIQAVQGEDGIGIEQFATAS